MKKFLLIIFTCIFIITLQSCDPFRYPTGVWICEELDIIIDFDDINCSVHDICGNGRGEILIEDEFQNIICQFNVSGYLNIGLLESGFSRLCNKSNIEWIFIGQLERKGRNKMNFTIEQTKEVYVFVKAD